jgi:hypothetical protein
MRETAQSYGFDQKLSAKERALQSLSAIDFSIASHRARAQICNGGICCSWGNHDR